MCSLCVGFIFALLDLNVGFENSPVRKLEHCFELVDKLYVLILYTLS